MTEFNLKKSYEGYKKNYPELPSFEELNKEFELILHDFKEEAEFLLKQIRRRMHEKVVYYCRLIEAVLHPSNSHLLILETNNFSKEYKEDLFNLYKKIMFVERNYTVLNLGASDDEEAEYIKETYHKMLEFKPFLLDLAKETKEFWQKESKKEEGDAFFGWDL